MANPPRQTARLQSIQGPAPRISAAATAGRTVGPSGPPGRSVNALALAEAQKSVAHGTRNTDRGAAFLQGLTFNLADEGAAGLIAARTAIDNATGHGRGYSAQDAYRARMIAEAQRRKAYEKAHPIESQLATGAGEFVQGFIPGGQLARGAKAVVIGGKSIKAAMAAEKARAEIIAARRAYETIAHAAGREAVKGGLQGAVSGWGGADPGERTKGAISGAVAGAVVGAPTPYVEHAVKKGATAVVRRVTAVPVMSRASRQVANLIEETVRADGLAPRWVRTPQEPFLPLDAAGENLVDVAVRTANAPGPGRNIALDALARQKAQFPPEPLVTLNVDPTSAGAFDFTSRLADDASLSLSPTSGSVFGRQGGEFTTKLPSFPPAAGQFSIGKSSASDVRLPAFSRPSPGLTDGYANMLRVDRTRPSLAEPSTFLGHDQTSTPLAFTPPPRAWEVSTQGVTPEPTLFGGALTGVPERLLPLLKNRATSARLGEALFGDPTTLRRLLDQKASQGAYDQVDRWAPRAVSLADNLYGADDKLAELLRPATQPKQTSRAVQINDRR